jgi:hypothetical protein
MSTYRGMIVQGEPLVTRDGVLFDPAPSQRVKNHSPCGFHWGYAGSGPAQLALAILLAEVGRKLAQRLYQSFKLQVIAALPQDGPWEITSTEVESWVAGQLFPSPRPEPEDTL